MITIDQSGHCIVDLSNHCFEIGCVCSKSHTIRDDILEQVRHMEKQAIENELREKRKAIMEILGIPLHTQYSVLTKDLCDIFLDDEKCKGFISKLKNKAFW